MLIKAKTGEVWRPNAEYSIYVSGPPGCGKTTFLRMWASWLLEHGYGLTVIDPHEFAQEVLQLIPRERFREVIWCNTSEGNIGINLAEYAPGQSVTAVVDAFHSIYHFPSEAYLLLKNALIVHSYVKDSHIGHVLKMIRSGDYRREILHYCEDPLARDYFRYDFNLLHQTPRLLQDASNPIKNAIQDLLSEAPLRKMFSVTHSALNIRDILEKNQITLFHVPKTLGTHTTALVESLLLAKFRSAGFARTNRQPFHIFLDEFQNIAAVQVITEMLEELRKFGVHLDMAHQGQNEEMVKAVLRTAYTKVCWKASSPAHEKEFPDHAKHLEREPPRAVAVKEGQADWWIGYPEVALSTGGKFGGYCSPEQLKRYSQLRYGNRSK